MKALTGKLRNGVDLTENDIGYAVTLLLSDKVDDNAKAEFLTELHRKGESADEIFIFVQLLLQRAIDPMINEADVNGPVIDICGTGGDGLNLFNVSTTIMFILAAGGATVVKHGNRSVTSQCGSADVLEALGAPLHLGPELLRECVKQHGLGFIFAREYHPSFRALAEMRQRLAREKTRTIFNLLGPLLNPARPKHQLIGVFSPRLTTIFGDVLRRLGRSRAWVVHGLTGVNGGMDDISICGPTTVVELADTKITSAVLDTRWIGIEPCPLEELAGGTAKENAAFLTGILSGELKGPKREMAIANAAGGFVVAGLAREMNHGIAMAREHIDNGKALAKLRALQSFKPHLAV
ncbi:MAG TPA: anthranilate phosphoribosyltransferase [Chthoniobacterales bacterium]